MSNSHYIRKRPIKAVSKGADNLAKWICSTDNDQPCPLVGGEFVAINSHKVRYALEKSTSDIIFKLDKMIFDPVKAEDKMKPWCDNIINNNRAFSEYNSIALMCLYHGIARLEYAAKDFIIDHLDDDAFSNQNSWYDFEVPLARVIVAPWDLFFSQFFLFMERYLYFIFKNGFLKIENKAIVDIIMNLHNEARLAEIVLSIIDEIYLVIDTDPEIGSEADWLKIKNHKDHPGLTIFRQICEHIINKA